MNIQNINKAAQKGFTLIELMIVVAIIAILAAIALPQYQNYVIKSQVNRVMSESGQLRTALEVCFNEGRTAIGNGAGQCDPGATGSNLLAGGGNAAPGVALPAGSDVPTVTDPLNNTSTIVAQFGNNANADIHGDTVTWTRDPQGQWTCTTNVDARWRPAGCQ